MTSQDEGGEDTTTHDLIDTCSSTSQAEESGTKASAQSLPFYSQRQSPLVQAHGASAFVERMWGRFGIHDMAHEWVTVFQSMVRSDADQPQHLANKDGSTRAHSSRRNRANGSSGIRLQIPDTILLNSSGQPSLWFATASSGRVKAKHSTHTTTREILQEFTTSSNERGTSVVAVQRIGFQTRMLTSADLKALCTEMESTRGVLMLPKLVRQSEVCSSDTSCNTDNSRALRPLVRSYCLQRFVPRYGGVRFFAVWRPQPEREEPLQPVDRSSRRNAVPDLQGERNHSQSVQDPKPPSPPPGRRPGVAAARSQRGIGFVCDLLVQRYTIGAHATGSVLDKREDAADGSDEDLLDGDIANGAELAKARVFSSDTWQGWMDEVERTEPLIPLYMKPHHKRQKSRFDDQSDDDNDEEHDELAQIKRVLHNMALEPDVVIPQLFQVKRVTGELLTRINRVPGGNTPARHCVGLACEFFLDAQNRQCYLSGISGIQWDNCQPSWDLLRFQDATAAKLSAFFTSHDQGSSEARGENNESAGSPKKRNQQLLSLRLFEELNPRFPSVQTPLSDAAQWKFRSALLPPDAAPRFIGAEVPKKFRRGRFHPLLRPEQAVSVSRLHLSPRAPSPIASAVRHPLSRRFANEEEVVVPPKPRDGARQRSMAPADTMYIKFFGNDGEEN